MVLGHTALELEQVNARVARRRQVRQPALFRARLALGRRFGEVVHVLHAHFPVGRALQLSENPLEVKEMG